MCACVAKACRVLSATDRGGWVTPNCWSIATAHQRYCKVRPLSRRNLPPGKEQVRVEACRVIDLKPALQHVTILDAAFQEGLRSPAVHGVNMTNGGTITPATNGRPKRVDTIRPTSAAVLASSALAGCC